MNTELEDTDADEGFSAEEQAYINGRDSGAAANASQEPSGAAQGGQQGQPGEGGNQPTSGQENAPEKRDRFVPYDAFHEERERRKGLEAELRGMNEKFTRASERFDVLNQLLQPEQKQGAEQDAMPDPEKDIFGAVNWLIKRNAALEQHVSGQAQRFDAQNEGQRVVSDYQNDARRFMAQEPAFGDAYKHLLNIRAAELRVLGAPEKDIQGIISREEQAIAANALKNGVSPAKAIYDLAMVRGFSKPQANQQAASGKTEAEKQLDVMQKAMSASQTLSGAGGGAPEGLTAQKILDMDEDEFDQYFSKLSRAEQKKFLGG